MSEAGRTDPGEFLAMDLRVHALLRDVPLHDVWTFSLRGGGDGRTVRDVRALLSDDDLRRINPVVGGLFRLRSWLGRIFGWEDEEQVDPAESYIHRLTEADRRRSLDDPGTRDGMFRIVYTFENETLAEIRNATVHAFLATAIEPTREGYTAWWGIYVRRVSWLTPVYMALIDPLRRLLVYPALISYLQRAWARSYSTHEDHEGSVLSD
jgi:hypothetical protein